MGGVKPLPRAGEDQTPGYDNLNRMQVQVLVRQHVLESRQVLRLLSQGLWQSRRQVLPAGKQVKAVQASPYAGRRALAEPHRAVLCAGPQQPDRLGAALELARLDRKILRAGQRGSTTA